MTREEVKRRLLDIERCTPIHTREDARDFEALETAIRVLSQEPCDDAISREAVIKDFTQWRGKMAYSIGEDYSGVSVLDKAIRVIKNMPSVTQKSVIEDIKTEIKTEMEEHRDIDDFSKGAGYGLRSAIGIIERRTYDL